MANTVGDLWAQARTHERAQDLAAAAPFYRRMVSLQPAHEVAHLRLAQYARERGDYWACRDHALQAADAIQSKSAWKNLPYACMRLMALDEHDRLHDLIMQADWRNPDIVSQSPVYSQHLWLMGHYKDALRFLDAAEKQVGPHHLLSYSRAQALRYCGRMDEATYQYERSLTINPGYAAAYWSLVHHRPSQEAGRRIAGIRDLLARPKDSPLDDIYLNYALFKELDDCGRIEEAWSSLSTGAGLMRDMVGTDRHAASKSANELLQWAGPVRQPGKADLDEDYATPLFVVGLPRTGTTVVERILGNLHGVACAGELTAFNTAVSRVSGMFFDGLSRQASLEGLSSLDMGRVGKEYHNLVRRHVGGRRFIVDKHPENFFNIPLIVEAFPNARIVCLHKEDMDAMFSNFKELFPAGSYSYSYDFASLAEHHGYFSKLRHAWTTRYPGNVLPVSYAELVREPEAIAARLAEFCGLEGGAQAADITRNQSPVATASANQVRAPIHRRNLGAWKRYEAQLAPLNMMEHRWEA